MPWVRLDDRFPSHRKVATLSDRAFRLHVSAICWCAENLTDGVIHENELRVIAHVRGMNSAAKELESAQLWERLPDGWQIHDYLDYNPSREQVLAERDRNAARQQAFRDRKKATKKASKKPDTTAEKIERNTVTAPVTDTVSNSAPLPLPYPVSPNGDTAAAREQQPRGLPDPLGELKTGIAAAGLSGVGWDLRESQWEYTRQALERVGPAAMVAYAVNSARLKGTPAGASAWVQGWRSLEPAPENGVAYLPAAASDTGPQQPPSHNASVIARFRQRNQEQQ